MEKEEEYYNDEIEKANIEIVHYKELLDKAKNKKSLLLRDQYTLKTGLNIGDNVKWNERGRVDGKYTVKTGEVINISTRYDRAELVVAIHKKDGTPGVQKTIGATHYQQNINPTPLP